MRGNYPFPRLVFHGTGQTKGTEIIPETVAAPRETVFQLFYVKDTKHCVKAFVGARQCRSRASTQFIRDGGWKGCRVPRWRGKSGRALSGV